MAKRDTPPTRPTGPTLADLTLYRTVGPGSATYTGAHLAQLIDATTPVGPGEHGWLTDPGEIAHELIELEQVVAAMGAAVTHEPDLNIGLGFGHVGKQLRRLAARVLALAPPANRRPDWYTVSLRTGAGQRRGR